MLCSLPAPRVLGPFRWGLRSAGLVGAAVPRRTSGRRGSGAGAAQINFLWHLGVIFTELDCISWRFRI